jgi:hypothetical protein
MGTKDSMSAYSEALRQRDLAVAQALVIREAAVAASETFRRYADIHRGKGDDEKAQRNEDEAYRLTAAIVATANLPDFRAHSARLEADLAHLRTERDTLIRQRAADLEALNAVQALHAQAVAERDEARRQVEAMREVVEAARYLVNNLDLVREAVPGEMPLREALASLDALAVPSTEVEG